MDESTAKVAEQIEAEYRNQGPDDFLTFVRGLQIPSAHGPVLFERCMADFQRKAFASLADALHSLKAGKRPVCRRYWIERTKKGSKDTDIACAVLWLIAFVDRPFLIQVCAANSKQAGIIEDRALAIIHYNPWLRDHIDVVEGCIRSKRMPREVKCQIEATGSAGAAQGPTPDLLILNELVHVEKWPVMRAHMNNADGVPRGLAVIVTNAGIKGSPAWVWRQNAIRATNWRSLIYSEPAPWISPHDMADAKARDPVGSEYRRLWKGKWVAGMGDAVDEETLEACFRMDGPHLGPVPGCQYLAGLDLGVTHDHAGLAVVAVNERKHLISIAYIRGWVPVAHSAAGGKKEVDIRSVRESCVEVRKRFNVQWFGYDPAAGGSFLAQELRELGVPMVEVRFSSTSLTAMAEAFVTAVSDGRLECYDDEEGRLRRDFSKFNIEHRPPSNYKLVALSDDSGHADVGTAVVITLPKAMQMIKTSMDRTRPDDTLWSDEDDLTPEEVEEMPDELRAIYEDEGEMGKESKRGRRYNPLDNDKYMIGRGGDW